MSPKKILVLCTGNSCRSQMVHGYLKALGDRRLDVYSAGIETHGVNPLAIQFMKEDGVDISNHTSNLVEEYDHIYFDLVITVCDHAKEHCPVLPGGHQFLHHSFADPSKVEGTEDEIAEIFRSVRNEIKSFCSEVVDEHLQNEQLE